MRLGVLALALVLVVLPLSAEAQRAGKVYRIGILSAGPVAPRAHQWDAFRQGLRELGYVEGRNILVEMRAPRVEGGSHDELAADLVRLKVESSSPPPRRPFWPLSERRARSPSS